MFVHEFRPGADTAATRRKLAGFDPEWITDSFELSPDGLWFNACSDATCSARDGRRWEVPPQVLARAGSGALEVLTLGPERRAAHVRIPVSADGDWEAIIAAGVGSAQPSVPFAGMTGAIEGEDGQRSGDLVWVGVEVPMAAAAPDLLWPIGLGINGRDLYSETRMVRE